MAKKNAKAQTATKNPSKKSAKKADASPARDAIEMAIARARALPSAARSDLLHRHSATEVALIHQRLVGEATPKTPRATLEKQILAALATPPQGSDAKPLDEATGNNSVTSEPGARADADDQGAQQHDANAAATVGPTEDAAPDAAPDVPAGDTDAAPDAQDAAPHSGDATLQGEPAAPPKPAHAPGGRDPRLPAVGTILVKSDRHGAERARCTIVEGGVEFADATYKSLSAAAIAAARALGLASKTQDGYAFWGLKKGTARPAKKDALASLEQAWAKYRERAGAVITGASGDERAKVHAAVSQQIATLTSLAATVA